MPLNKQALSDKFGVAITNVDLSKDIDQSLFDEIVDVFVKKQVLVFRDQHIEPQHQVAFSRRFGPLEMLYDEDQRGEQKRGRKPFLDGREKGTRTFSLTR